MTKFQKLSKLFIVGVKDFRWSRELETFLKEFKVDGLALFNSPFDSPDNIWSDRETSLEALYDFVKRASQYVRFLSVDQEGGRVRRLRGAFLPLPAAQILAEKCGDDPSKLAALKKIYQLAARQMSSSGIHLNFAPNCDRWTPQSSNVIGDRSYGDSIEKVCQFAEVFLSAFSEAGVATTIKHFPGHGPTEMDSHESVAVVFKNEKELLAEDTIIFERLAKKTSAIMTAHIALPDYPDRIFSLDRELFTKFKRRISQPVAWITDDLLSMKAVSEIQPWIQALELPYDFLLLCGDLDPSVQAIESCIRKAESQTRTFSDEQQLDKRIERSQNFFNTAISLAPLPQWKRQILELEQEGLAELESL